MTEMTNDTDFSTSMRRSLFSHAPIHGLDPLEPRVLLSTAQGADNLSSDLNQAVLAMSSNAIWFEDLQPQVNSSSGVTVQVVDGQAEPVGVINHEWLIQLTPDAALAAGSVAGAGDILGLPEIGVQVVRGLGAQGLILVTDAYMTGDFTLPEYLAGNENIDFLATNYEFAVSSLPNDSYFSSLWGLNNTGQSGGTVDADIDAPEAWAMAGGPTTTVVVGVIDTGVDYTHPDLVNNMWTNPGEIAGNGIDDDNNGFIDDIYGYDFANNDNNPMDDNGHGTHVSGTIAATPDNSRGVTGVAPNAQIMALKFISASGSGSTANAIRAINYATMMNVDYGVNVLVTNNSWGGGGWSTALYNAIAASGQAGMLFISSAGNDGDDVDLFPSYPASYNLDNIISVAATDRNDHLASFSNYGAVNVDIAAPGVSIRSTLPGNSYGYYSGTSMASPHVAGAAALYLGQHPDASVAEVKNAILAGGDTTAAATGTTSTGHRLNLVGMLNMAPDAGENPDPGNGPAEPIPEPPPPPPPPSADIQVSIATDPWNDIILPGDRGRVAVEFENVGELDARGVTQIAFYLSLDTTFDQTDVLVYENYNYRLNLKSGQSRSASFNIKLPGDLLQGTYHLIAVINPDSEIADPYTENNVFVTTQTHDLRWMVGDVDGRRNTSLILPDELGQLVRFTLSGAGTAVITGDNGAQNIVLTGTDTSTRFTITSVSRNDVAQIGDVLVTGSMNSFVASSVNMVGDLEIQGSIRTLTLGDLSDMSIALGISDSSNIRMGSATDVSLSSLGSIRTLMANSWTDTDAQIDSILATAISSLNIRGDVLADITLTDEQAADMRASISGSLFGGTWLLASGLSSMRVSGEVVDFTLNAGGTIRSLTTGRDGRLQADITAETIGAIRAGGQLSGSILATEADSRGNAINQISASSINQLQISAAGHVSQIRSGDIQDLTVDIQGNLSTLMGVDIADVNLDILGDVRTINVVNWDGGSLSANTLSTLNVRNNIYDVDMDLTYVPEAGSRTKYVLNSLRVTGVAQGLNLVASGDVNMIMVGAMFDSLVQIGASDDDINVESVGDFGPTGSLRTFMVRGLRGVDGASFDTSSILVKQIGNVTLQEVEMDEDDEPFGIVAESVSRFTRRDPSASIRLSNLDESGTADQTGAFILRIL